MANLNRSALSYCLTTLEIRLCVELREQSCANHHPWIAVLVPKIIERSQSSSNACDRPACCANLHNVHCPLAVLLVELMVSTSLGNSPDCVRRKVDLFGVMTATIRP